MIFKLENVTNCKLKHVVYFQKSLESKLNLNSKNFW